MAQNTSCTVEIESIEIVAAPSDMVDITVEDDHTYWVSTTGDRDWETLFSKFGIRS